MLFIQRVNVIDATTTMTKYWYLKHYWMAFKFCEKNLYVWERQVNLYFRYTLMSLTPHLLYTIVEGCVRFRLVMDITKKRDSIEWCVAVWLHIPIYCTKTRSWNKLWLYMSHSLSPFPNIWWTVGSLWWLGEIN